jgi:hypothetical protein
MFEYLSERLKQLQYICQLNFRQGKFSSTAMLTVFVVDHVEGAIKIVTFILHQEKGMEGGTENIESLCEKAISIAVKGVEEILGDKELLSMTLFAEQSESVTNKDSCFLPEHVLFLKQLILFIVEAANGDIRWADTAEMATELNMLQESLMDEKRSSVDAMYSFLYSLLTRDMSKTGDLGKRVGYVGTAVLAFIFYKELGHGKNGIDKDYLRSCILLHDCIILVDIGIAVRTNTKQPCGCSWRALGRVVRDHINPELNTLSKVDKY